MGEYECPTCSATFDRTADFGQIRKTTLWEKLGVAATNRPQPVPDSA